MMTTISPALWLVLLALAVYRLSYLITTDKGPWLIFDRWRRWIGRRYGINSWQHQGVTCVFCQSVWYALPAALAFDLVDLWLVRVLVVWLALAGAALLLHWLVLTWISRVESS